MKKITSIWILLLLTAMTSFGQVGNVFHSDFEQHAFSALDPHQVLFATNPRIDHYKYKEYQSEIASLLEKLQNKKEKWNDERIVEKMFFTMHHKLLKRYDQHAFFGDLFYSGRYDCVSGTALMAIGLEALGYDYTIHEFDYHTFLVVNLSHTSILLESTDPINGFVTNQDEIDRKIIAYGSGNDHVSEDMKPVGSKSDFGNEHINNQIELTQLAGLQYYNLAVYEINGGHPDNASRLIEKAYILYPSKRISEARSIFYTPQLVTTR